MLSELSIRNVALIEALTIQFSPGFNVLTGETGAGKSIVVDSVNLVLGGRADRDFIRTGAEKATVTALFDVSQNEGALREAEEIGCECEDGQLIMSREIARSGRNLCRINGTPVPLSSLRQLTSLLTDVHGQHEHQRLIDPAHHIEYLDAHGGDELRRKAQSVARCYAARSETAAILKKKIRQAEEAQRLAEGNKARLADVAELRLKPGETQKLEKKLENLESYQRIRGALEKAYRLTYAGENGHGGAQEQILAAAEELHGLSDLAPVYGEIEKTLRDAYYLVEDAGRGLQKTLDEASSDPALAERIADRLEAIYRLEKRYGMDAESLLAYCAQAEAQAREMETDGSVILEMKAEYKKRDGLLRQACDELTACRTKLARELETRILRHLSELGMEKTRFEISLRPLAKPTPNGMDEVEFLISPNPGEPLKPLGSVASGGELSRVMLALKAASADGGTDSMVFDEIDTGVSGRIAQAVGEKMRLIAQNKQVLCVTHLAQIAAMGTTHFLVEKTTRDGRTASSVRELDREGRVREISRLLDGGGGETGRKLAEEMLSRAEE